MGPRGVRGASGGRYRKEADHTGATRLDNIVITIFIMAGTRILTARLPDSIVDCRSSRILAESDKKMRMASMGSGRSSGGSISCRKSTCGSSCRTRAHRGRHGQARASSFSFKDVSDEPLNESLELFSPAKINLFLRITKRRDDGFHELASLFQTIAFGDSLKVTPLPSTAIEDEIFCTDPTVPCDERNLVWKAAELFRKKTGNKQKFSIDLRKEVPAGAGLGGGSGNAATMLWAANKICGEDRPDSDLLEWSGDIGSDISFFFSGGTAYCTGRGEIVEDMPPALPSGYPIVLVKPALPLSTAAVYGKLDVSRCSDVDPEELKQRFYQEALMASSER